MKKLIFIISAATAVLSMGFNVSADLIDVPPIPLEPEFSESVSETSSADDESETAQTTVNADTGNYIVPIVLAALTAAVSGGAIAVLNKKKN